MSNRALRRAIERKRKQDTIRIDPYKLREIKNEVTQTAITATFEDVIPLFAMYLVENFRCKANGAFKFMDWFDAQMGMVNEDPYKIHEYKQRLKDEAGVEIRYTRRTR